MTSEPHPTLPGVFVTTPAYVGTVVELARMQTCQHVWPDGLPERMDPVGTNAECGSQRCTLGCGAVRAIYRMKE